MWDRKEIKEKGKAAFKANYWRCVLVALILTLITGAGAGASSAGGARTINVRNEISNNQQDDTQQNVNGATDAVEEFDVDQFLEEHPDFNPEQFLEDNENNDVDLNVEGTSFAGNTSPAKRAGEGLAAVLVIILVTALIILIVALSCVMGWLVLNPLKLGCARFFYVNTEMPADVGEVGFAFSKKYGNYVKAMLVRDVYTILWSFLFIIPGLIKGAYSYRLVPYILMDNPDIGAKEAVTRSREMMHGHKWRTFVYDLSFIGWMLLSVLTLGLVSIFYMSPYKKSSDAELYKAIRDGGRAQYEPEVATEIYAVPAAETGAKDTVDVL